MNLSRKQERVLSNSLAWVDSPYGVMFKPSEADIEEFFAWNDRGIPTKSPGAVELIVGWRCHYGNEYSWIEDWENGKSKNPPQAPPQAWVYDAYFGKPSDWQGWLNITQDYLTARLVNPEMWERQKPCYRRAQVLWAFHSGRLNLSRLHLLLGQQKG